MADEKKVSIAVQTTADLSGAKAVVKEMGNVKTAVAEAGKAASTLKLGDIPGVAGLAASLAPAAAAAALVGSTIGFLKESVAAAEESTQSQILLNQALANTGQYSAAAGAQIDALTGHYQALTNIADETWSDGAAKLIAFGAKVEELPALFPVLEGLAGRMGGDVVGAATIMGRALNGNTRGLVQFGIKLEEGATRAEILAALTTAAAKGQGLLEAKTKTLTGAVEGVHMAFGDLQEEVGKNITQGGEIATVFTLVAESIRFVTRHLDDGLKAFDLWTGIPTVLKELTSALRGSGDESAKLAAKSADAAVQLDKTGDAAEEAGKGLDNAKEDAKALGDELKRAAEEAKATEDALKKVSEMKREIAEATETPQEKSARLKTEESDARAAVAADYKKILRKDLPADATPKSMLQDIMNPTSGVNDPAAKAGMLQNVNGLVKAEGAVKKDNADFAKNNQQEETPAARAGRLAYEALPPAAQASALAGDAVAGRAGAGGVTGGLAQAIEKARAGLKDGDQGGEMEQLLKLMQDFAAHAKNDADQKKRWETRIKQVEELMKAARS